MSKHTPGPWTKAERLNGPWWHISSDHTVNGQPCKSGRQAVACVHGESKRGATAYAEMFEANAHLIAAAPELLEALEHIMRCIPTGGFAQIHHGSSTWEQIDAAVSKARGELFNIN